MSSIERFEDLIAWQKARLLARRVYEVTRGGSLAKDLGLASQMQRAAVSIMANIAEGFERSGRGEFHHFLLTAKASCAELRSHLYLARDIDYLSETDFRKLLEAGEEVGRILDGLSLSVGRQRRQTAPSALMPHPSLLKKRGTK